MIPIQMDNYSSSSHHSSSPPDPTSPPLIILPSSCTKNQGSMTAIDKNNLHIVIFPWLAFGHMIPYLQLSKHLAQKGHQVTFISTPKNIDRLPKPPPQTSPFLTFHKIPLPPNPNTHLPLNAEATTDLPYDQVQYLKESYDNLKQPLYQFLQSSKPDWIFHDFAPYWISQEIAPKLGIKTAFFSIFIPEFLSFVGPMSGDSRVNPEDFTVPPDWIPFPSSIAMRYFEIKRIIDGVTGNITGVSDVNRLKLSAHYSDLLVARACPEFSQEWIQLLENHVYKKPIFPIGQLPTSEFDSGGENPAWQSAKSWLDEQQDSSVVYVAFGSEAKPSQQELTEIALGLEKAELPFFWVFRTRCGESDPEPIELPDGFEDRVKKRGVVWTGWAPQLKILEHGSVGGFLTHSGWSSVVEAIQSEKALVLMTFLADQGINARVLEGKKMGLSVPRKELDGSFSRDSVAESLKIVMVEKEGEVYRERIREMKGLFVNEERDEELIDGLLGFMKMSINGGEG